MNYFVYKKINFLFFFLTLLFLNGIASAEWITKKSDISKKLLKVDDMYSKGYLTKSECVKAKAKLLKITSASGMCDNVVVKTNASNSKTFNWVAEVSHPKTDQIFTAVRVANEKSAIKIALGKCLSLIHI